MMGDSAERAVIVSAVRTPIGKLNGCLSTLQSYELGSCVIKQALERCGIHAADVDEVIMGQVLTANQGQNPARHAAVLAGCPHAVPALMVNQVCGSGIRSIVMAAQDIKCGDSAIVVAGGQESMSNAPHCIHMRTPGNFGNKQLQDSLVSEGLTDCFNNCSMGVTAENVAKKHNICREVQDSFAVKSQTKYRIAEEAKAFESEIINVEVRGRKQTTNVFKDEHPRPNSSLEGLSGLRPAFTSPEDKSASYNGTVTAGNSSGINDGAAAVIVMSQAEATKRKLSPIATVVNWAQVGIDPLLMGLGPIPAIRKLLIKCSWKIDEVDLFEVNEAFASQSVAVMDELKIPEHKLNVNGGAIALGHPLGASGTRIVVTLLHAMRVRKAKRGIAALCIGGGMGIAIAFEQ